ncbi:hypothetical protein V1478_005977 [Vespula squamosa]|uniref:Uncharacterized protein n=1 Tax=Vespula squamosa TaxID=30214 RepID=A0ABD2B8X5_VESSQ
MHISSMQRTGLVANMQMKIQVSRTAVFVFPPDGPRPRQFLFERSCILKTIDTVARFDFINLQSWFLLLKYYQSRTEVTFVITKLHVDYPPANIHWTTDESSSSRSQQWQKSNIGRQEEEETGGRRHEYSLEWNQNQRRYDVDRPRILHRSGKKGNGRRKRKKKKKKKKKRNRRRKKKKKKKKEKHFPPLTTALMYEHLAASCSPIFLFYLDPAFTLDRPRLIARDIETLAPVLPFYCTLNTLPPTLLPRRLADWLVGWLVGRSVGWLVGWLAGWLADGSIEMRIFGTQDRIAS